MLYTRTNPSPSRIHWSLSDTYSSWPAVSRTSSMHDWPSIWTCLRYESSIVGSYVSTKWLRQSCACRQHWSSHSAELQASTYLNREGGLANTTVSKHDQLVQSHFSRHLDWWGWVQARVVEREVAVVRRVRRICGSSISAVGGGRSSDAVRQCKVAG